MRLKLQPQLTFSALAGGKPLCESDNQACSVNRRTTGAISASVADTFRSSPDSVAFTGRQAPSRSSISHFDARHSGAIASGMESKVSEQRFVSTTMATLFATDRLKIQNIFGSCSTNKHAFHFAV